MKFFVLALFSLGLLSGLFCDLRADNSIRMYLDYARFRYDDEQTYLEIYYSIHRQTAAATATQVPLKFYLNDTKSATTLASSELALTIDKQSAEGMQGSVIKTVLPPGEYQIKMVRMASETQTRVDSVHYSFSTTPFQSEKIKLSDLELCSNIAQRSAKSSSLFFKNTMEVYPNPTHLFGLNNPNVFYYIELYNIRPGAGEKDLEIQVAVKDGEGNTVEQKSYNRNRQNESLVEVGSFNVSEYRSGLYTLVFAVIDHGKDYSVLNINNFYVLNPGSMPAGEEEMLAGFPSSRFFTMGGA
nr:hypothetical protein [Calditrichia bacterium]